MSCTGPASALDRVEQQFLALTARATKPLTLDGFEIGHGLPDRPIPLDELRDRLLARTATNALKGAAWSALVRRAQIHADPWAVAAAGVMMRGLRGIVGRVSRGIYHHRHDLHSEVLLGFLEALRSIDPDAPGLPGLLWCAAYRRGVAARRAEQNAGMSDLDNTAARIRRLNPPEGHPDLVLLKAVKEGVIAAGDARLIGDTRVEGQPLAVAAQRAGVSYWACAKRRSTAERRLARYLGHRSLVASSQEPASPTAPAAA
ncbi:sigma-70 family RNA polymerase sigma factor [Actinomycetes bacterium KLBMP 9797]